MSYPGRPNLVPGLPMGMPYMPIPGPPMMPQMMPVPHMMNANMMGGGNFNHRSRMQRPPHMQRVFPSVEIPKGPPVTLFVGNITERAPDLMIRHILQACGHVNSWKKVSGFGFCEYANPDAGLRAIRLLHEMELGDKKLVVTVDAKAKTILDEYKQTRKAGLKEKLEGAKDAENGDNSPVLDENVDEDEALMRQEDKMAVDRIRQVQRDFKKDLERVKVKDHDNDHDKPKTGAEITQQRVSFTKRRLQELTQAPSDLDQDPEIMTKLNLDTDIEKKDIITREIGKFREIMKKQEEERDVERKRREERDKEEKGRKGPESPVSNGRNRSPLSPVSPVSNPPLPQHRSHRTRSRSRERSERRSERERSVRNERERSVRNERERSVRNERERSVRNERERSVRNERERSVRNERERSVRNERERSVRNDRERSERSERSKRSSPVRDRDRDRKSKTKEREVRDDSAVVRRDRDMAREKEEEEEAKDKKKADRKAREKEAAYQERLRLWEQRERHKAKELAKEKDKKKAKEEDKQKEAKRLKEFLEDYDDERDDVKYYKGREMQRRLDERIKEMESDTKDRQKEKEEIEELRVKIFNSQNKNPDEEFRKVLRQRESLFKPKILVEITPAEAQAKQQARELEMKEQRLREEKAREEALRIEKAEVELEARKAATSAGTAMNEEEPGPINQDYSDDDRGASPGPASPDNDSQDMRSSPPPQDRNKKKKLDVKEVFNNDEEDDSKPGPKKRKLVPLDYGDEKKKKEEKKDKEDSMKSLEEKKKYIKSFIEKIPTDKKVLFNYQIDWAAVDSQLMERKIRPWINKKIIEYIGEPEPTLVDFICSKVLAGSAPQGVLDDVQMVLDEEAEIFVVKMWRLLIYETEAKKLGLGK